MKCLQEGIAIWRDVQEKASRTMTEPDDQTISAGDDPSGTGEGLLMETEPSTSGGTDDLPLEQIDGARRKARISAAVLIGVFLLISLAPYPWNIFAPLLLLVPLIQSIAGRMRRGTVSLDALPDTATASRKSHPSVVKEPYSCTPKDPGDPRRYKPIN